MKRLSIVAAALVAFLAIVAASASAEGTGPKVTLRTAAGPLKKGAPLVAFSSALIFSTAQGDIECFKNTLSGILKANGKEKLAGEINLAESIGEPAFEEGLCFLNHVNGPASVAWQNLPWKLKLTNTGTVQVTTGVADKTVKFVLTWPHYFGVKCIYSTKKWISNFPVSATPVPFVIETDRQSEFKVVPGGAEGCSPPAWVKGRFEVTSNGEAVEVEVK